MGFVAGDVAGDYRILGKIGAGGMGAVYKVQHVLSNRLEAMKVLLPDLHGNPGLEERFLSEIRVQASLSHPNIAALHTAFRLRDQLLMVMEFVEGRNLGELMLGRLPLESGVRHIRGVLEALTFAHAKGVVHRDIKPANILVTADGNVKLVDFGIASVARNTARVTTQGMAIGSLAYMSPEQARGEVVDGRSDIYSVGATLYEMATGKPPIRGDSEFAIVMGHQSQVPDEPVGAPPDISRAIMKALEKKVERRFQTAGEFLQALGGTREQGSGPGELWDTAQIDRATKELAAIIGPIARVIVKRELKKAADWKQLKLRLAEEISGASERESFLRRL